MSEFNYLREKARMLKSFRIGAYEDFVECIECSKCGLSHSNNQRNVVCSTLELLYPDEAEAIVRKWAEEHPRKTRKDILLEKFPNAKVSHTGRARICAYALGLVSEEEYREKCCEYPTAYCTDCWNAEVGE